jgi:macrodomain Ter protein organizer (MatP/YcbG family)
MGDPQKSVETMEELIRLDYQDRGIDYGRRDQNSELCESIRSSCDYWEDIDQHMNDDIKSRFKQLALRRKQLLNATENETKAFGSSGKEAEVV